MYPALAVLHALQNESSTLHEVLWVGGVGGMEEELVKRAGAPFETISAAGVHGVGLRALPHNLLLLGRGYRQARKIIRRFRPEVMFFTGGYIAAPVALAGFRTPVALFVPDIEPGLALKTLARFADCIAVTDADSRAFFSRRARIEVTGYPVRPDLLEWDAPRARQALGLQEDRSVLLVFGGSKGARSINRALLGALPELLQDLQVVHISGQLDWPEVSEARRLLAQTQPGLAAHYHAHAYLHEEMGAALAAADLVISRAGASTLGEFPAFGLPAILAPYPHAWRYQQVNARSLEQHGAALVIPDAELPARLLPAVRELIFDASRRQQMQQAMRSLARPQAANRIADLLQALAAQAGKGSVR